MSVWIFNFSSPLISSWCLFLSAEQEFQRIRSKQPRSHGLLGVWKPDCLSSCFISLGNWCVPWKLHLTPLHTGPSVYGGLFLSFHFSVDKTFWTWSWGTNKVCTWNGELCDLKCTDSIWKSNCFCRCFLRTVLGCQSILRRVGTLLRWTQTNQLEPDGGLRDQVSLLQNMFRFLFECGSPGW